MRRLLASSAFLFLAISTPALAQAVEVAPLAAPDAFSTAGRQTGLSQDLWRGASAETVATVLSKLAEKPLSPAAAALARRVLVTGAPGPAGVGADPGVLAARARALFALGDPKAAAAITARAPDLDRSPELAQMAAESALLAGDDSRACAVGEALTVGREEIYWLRLRAYCQAAAGRSGQAQLTFELAQSKAKDPVFGRLMGARLAGGGSPGPASLRNGLDYALSRSLGLDLAQAKPAPAVAAALATGEPAEPAWTPPAGDSDLLTAARAIAAGKPAPPDLVARLLDAAVKAPEPAAQGAALIVAAWAGAEGPDLRGRVAALATPESHVPAGRHLAMDSAVAAKLTGETAMLALWSCAEAGPAGPAAGERARIVRALAAVGLQGDARNFALEGLLGAP